MLPLLSNLNQSLPADSSKAAANNDPDTFTDPQEFNLDRPLDAYIVHGHGPRGDLGRDMFLAYGTALLKVAARTEGLRKALGGMGELKRVYVGKEGKDGKERGTGKRRRHYLTADWAYVVDEPTGECFSLFLCSFCGEREEGRGLARIVGAVLERV